MPLGSGPYRHGCGWRQANQMRPTVTVPSSMFPMYAFKRRPERKKGGAPLAEYLEASERQQDDQNKNDAAV